MEPGGSVGGLDVQGDYVQDAAGRLAVDIAGTEPDLQLFAAALPDLLRSVREKEQA